MYTYKPNYIVEPGETIAELIEERGTTVEQVAEVLDMPEDVLRDLISGKQRVTKSYAAALEQAFALSAQFWLNLEANFQRDKARLSQQS